ncbi:hypothetical protein K461DRAFT_218935 [Myriangium duriaei CBS 260.36]|uniref:HNH domain-containing protein n=1 Tax=Myriangium duriaei CBS 260.36 TaxID=1168546 RepID=A0A9P4JCY9_9PEZI|nr:hypothetical protein K461DRAFT_218935 [Myriangium duriaei CBS 260.36]
MSGVEGNENYSIFRDCLSELIISKLAPSKERRRVKGRKNEIKPVKSQETPETAAEDLAEFIEFLAQEVFSGLDDQLQSLSYESVQNDNDLATKYQTPLDSETYDAVYSNIPPSVLDSFSSYAVLPPTVDPSRALEPVFNAYVDAATAAPPEHDHTVRAVECELCDRTQLPLTYHHLIPRQMHAKAVKRGWAKEWELQKVAWLCRACHSFIHRFVSNEELARELNTMERLLEKEEVRNWARWVGRIRWKKT